MDLIGQRFIDGVDGYGFFCDGVALIEWVPVLIRISFELMPFLLGVWERGKGFGGVAKDLAASFSIAFSALEIQDQIATETGKDGVNREVVADAGEILFPSDKAEVALVFDAGGG